MFERRRPPHVISCSGRASLAATWVFGIVLSGFAWTLWVVLLDQPPEWVRKFDVEWFHLGAASLAALVTVFALVSILVATRNWRLLGPAHLELDPYPPGVGGEIGGVMTLQVRPAQLDECVLAMQCIRRRRNASSSSRNSTWHETVLWEAEGRPHVDDAGRSSRLVLRFPIPADQPASFSEANEQIVWRVHLEVNVEGRQLRRTFTVPVGDHPVPAGTLRRYPLTPDRPVSEDLPRAWVREHREAGRAIFHFPPFRHLKTIMGLATFGAIFFGGPGAIMLWMRLTGDGPPMVLPILFLLFGFLMVLPIFWLPFSLRVTASRDGLQARRAWFGLPVGAWTLGREEIERFKASSNKQIRFSDQRQEVFHHLLVHTRDGRKKRCSGDLPGPIMIERYEERLQEALDFR